MNGLSKPAAHALIWLALLTMPYWMGAIGGYTPPRIERSDSPPGDNLRPPGAAPRTPAPERAPPSLS